LKISVFLSFVRRRIFVESSVQSVARPGLPDGTYIFKPKIPIWVNFLGLETEEVDKFYGHLVSFTVIFVYFKAIWYNLWSFGIFVVFWYRFPRFGKYYREKSGNPDPDVCLSHFITGTADQGFVASQLILSARIILLLQ
jgi:hypothetical protein